MTLLMDHTATPQLAADSPLGLTRAAPGLWRVTDAAGRVIGHLQLVGDGAEARFRARRLHRATRRFHDVGDFWSAHDAAECLRLGR